MEVSFDSKTFQLSDPIVKSDDGQWCILLNKNDGHLLSKFLKTANILTKDLFDILSLANKYFTEFVIPFQSVSQIEKYVANLNQAPNTWNSLTSRPDYNLIRFNRRKLPFSTNEEKLWKAANIKINDYPTNITSDDTEKDFNGDLKIAKDTNNNYLGWQILMIENYPDIPTFVKQILILEELGMKKLALTMACNLLISPYNCAIVKNAEFWNWLKPQIIIDTPKSCLLNELIRYCMSYAMYIMRHEETTMFSKVIRGYRTIFTIDEASNLPIFSCHPMKSPYVLQLTGNTPLLSCLPLYLHGQRRICTREEFMKRFEIATGGAFKGIDLKKLNAAVTGSILVPCAHVSPLESGFDEPFPYDRKIDVPENANDAKFLRYINYYYPGYESLLEEDYKKEFDIENSKKEKIVYEADEDPLKVARNKEKIITSCIDLSKQKTTFNTLSDIDVSITASKMEDFREKAMILYNQIVENCKHRGPVYISEVKTMSSTKYKLHGPGIPRPMDIFKIFYIPEIMVKKFHTHPVKMFYDGDLKMFRSCISSLLSGIGEDYHWFSCNKVAADILAKSMMRGITTVLNSSERAAFSSWLETNSRWSKIFKHYNINTSKIYGCVTPNHPFFVPCTTGAGIRKGLKKFVRNVPVYTNFINIPNIKRPNFTMTFRDTNNVHAPDVANIPLVIDNILDDSYDHTWLDEINYENNKSEDTITIMNRPKEFSAIEDMLDEELDEPESLSESEESQSEPDIPVLVIPKQKPRVVVKQKHPVTTNPTIPVEDEDQDTVAESDETEEEPENIRPKLIPKIAQRNKIIANTVASDNEDENEDEDRDEDRDEVGEVDEDE